MRRSLRWMLVPCLLVTAACTADGPLAPQLAPEPAGLQLNEETPDTARGLALWLSFTETIPADTQEPLYIVDGVIWQPGSIGSLDPNSIEHIAVTRGDPTAIVGCKTATDLVIITTRVAPARRRS
jgi:hypothetical protein